MKTTDQRPCAQDVILGHITGFWVSQLVFVAAKLGLADALARGPLKPAVLAKRVGANAPTQGARSILEAVVA